MINTPTKSWSDARVHCQNLNGDLASFSSAEEVAGVVASTWSWIGLKEDEEVSKQFLWLDGSILAPTAWLGWASGQPNKPNSCGMIKDGKLYDWHCTSSFPFVCKIPVQQSSPGMYRLSKQIFHI